MNICSNFFYRGSSFVKQRIDVSKKMIGAHLCESGGVALGLVAAIRMAGMTHPTALLVFPILGYSAGYCFKKMVEISKSRVDVSPPVEPASEPLPPPLLALPIKSKRDLTLSQEISRKRIKQYCCYTNLISPAVLDFIRQTEGVRLSNAHKVKIENSLKLLNGEIEKQDSTVNLEMLYSLQGPSLNQNWDEEMPILKGLLQSPVRDLIDGNGVDSLQKKLQEKLKALSDTEKAQLTTYLDTQIRNLEQNKAADRINPSNFSPLIQNLKEQQKLLEKIADAPIHQVINWKTLPPKNKLPLSVGLMGYANELEKKASIRRNEILMEAPPCLIEWKDDNGPLAVALQALFNEPSVVNGLEETLHHQLNEDALFGKEGVEGIVQKNEDLDYEKQRALLKIGQLMRGKPLDILGVNLLLEQFHRLEQDGLPTGVKEEAFKKAASLLDLYTVYLKARQGNLDAVDMEKIHAALKRLPLSLFKKENLFPSDQKIGEIDPLFALGAFNKLISTNKDMTVEEYKEGLSFSSESVIVYSRVEGKIDLKAFKKQMEAKGYDISSVVRMHRKEKRDHAIVDLMRPNRKWFRFDNQSAVAQKIQPLDFDRLDHLEQEKVCPVYFVSLRKCPSLLRRLMSY